MLTKKNQEENVDDVDDDDHEETNVEIAQKETSIVLDKFKGAVHKYGNTDTIQLFQ